MKYFLLFYYYLFMYLLHYNKFNEHTICETETLFEEELNDCNKQWTIGLVVIQYFCKEKHNNSMFHAAI